MKPINVLIIEQHDTLPAGAYIPWCESRGHRLTLVRPYRGDTLPRSPGDYDLMILTGGPQETDQQDPETGFDGPAQMELIRRFADVGRMVVGTCLGAQLMGYALGEKEERSPQREIGCFPLQLTQEGQKDPLLADIPAGLLVGQWHRNMPGLPEGAVVLAETAGCPRQFVRYGPLLYGMQAHMEFTHRSMAYLLGTIEKELPHDRYDYVWTKEQLLAFDYEPMNRALMGFLDRLVDAYQS